MSPNTPHDPRARRRFLTLVAALVAVAALAIGLGALRLRDELRTQAEQEQAERDRAAAAAARQLADAQAANARLLDAAFADMTNPDPAVRTEVFVRHPSLAASLDALASDAQRSTAAAHVRVLLADADDEVRLAAAEYVDGLPVDLPWAKPADARPALVGLLAAKAAAVRVRAAARLVPGGHAGAKAVLLAIALDTRADVAARRAAVAVPFPEMIDAQDRLAWDVAQPVALRVKAVAAQRQAAPHRLLTAALLERAVSDAKEEPDFRAFAAQFFVPDTAARFAVAVRRIADAYAADSPLSTFHRVLAHHLRSHFAGDKRPPKEWVTEDLAAVLATSSAMFHPPQVKAGYDADGNPWAVVAKSDAGTDLEGVYADLLVARGAGVVPLLVDALHHPPTNTRHYDALAKLGPAAAAAVPALLRLFDPVYDEAFDLAGLHDAQLNAAWVVGAIGPAARPAADPITRLMWSPRFHTPADLEVLYAAIVKVDGRLGEVLAGVLRSAPLRPANPAADTAKWQWAANEARKLSRSGAAAVPALAERIAADFAADVSPYITAIAAIGPASVPALGELLSHPEPKVRIAAGYALALIGPTCRAEAAPLLRRAIQAEQVADVKQALMDALGAVDPPAAEALGWPHRRPDADPADVAPTRVTSAGGKQELVRPPAFYYRPPVYVPLPINLPRPGSPDFGHDQMGRPGSQFRPPPRPYVPPRPITPFRPRGR